VGFTRSYESSSRSSSRRPCLGDTSCLVVAIMLVVVAAVGVGSVKGQLSMGFYANSCPGAESIITTAVRTASVVDPVLPAKILRLFFHDCFVQVLLIIPSILFTTRYKRFAFGSGVASSSSLLLIFLCCFVFNSLVL
jgi:hypothetical protein